MNIDTRPRTYFTLLVELMKELGGEPMKQDFLRDMGASVLAHMKHRELTEEEFQFGLKKIREEAPAFANYLLQYEFLPA